MTDMPLPPDPLSSHIQIDDERDILTVFGVKIARPLLKVFASPSPPGWWYRVVCVEDGVATIETRTTAEISQLP